MIKSLHGVGLTSYSSNKNRNYAYLDNQLVSTQIKTFELQIQLDLKKRKVLVLFEKKSKKKNICSLSLSLEGCKFSIWEDLSSFCCCCCCWWCWCNMLREKFKFVEPTEEQLVEVFTSSPRVILKNSEFDWHKAFSELSNSKNGKKNCVFFFFFWSC